MAKNTTKFGKQHLEDCEVSINISIEEYYPVLVFTLMVKNYTKLKKNVIYYTVIGSYRFTWTFFIIKAKGLLFLNLSTNIAKKKVFFSLISYDSTALSKRMNLCTEINAGNYITQFCNHAILDPRNQYLKDDVLKITCKYNIGPVETFNQTTPYGQLSGPSIAHEPIENFEIAYFKELFPDLFVYVQDDVFPVHKFLLRALSKCFKKILESGEEVNEIRIHASPRIFRYVMVYIYRRELKDMTIDLTIQVFILAHRLQIPCLVRRCVGILGVNMTKENVADIFEAAIICQNIDLKNDTMHFLSQFPALQTALLEAARKFVVGPVINFISQNS